MKHHRMQHACMKMSSPCPVAGYRWPWRSLLGAWISFLAMSMGVSGADVHVFDEETSRDYRLIGIVQGGDHNSYDLYLENRKTNQRTPLVATPDVYHARFSPNLEFIAFHRRESGDACFWDKGKGEKQRVHVISRSNPARVWASSECAFNFEWGPDSKHLAYNISWVSPDVTEAAYQIRVLELETNKEYQVTSGTSSKLHPRFSPDGSLILYRPGGSTLEFPRSRTLALIEWRTGTEVELVREDVGTNVAWPEGPEQVRQWLPGNILVWDVVNPAHPEVHGSWALDVGTKECWKFSSELGAKMVMPRS